MKKDIVHIYSGTQGLGGLYLDEIYNTLLDFGFKQEIFVSHYFPFDYGKKIFFKRSDLASGAKKGKFRYYVRALELVFGLLKALIYIIFNRPKVINLSVNSAFFIDVYFIKAIKKFTSSKLIITCHDVIPFGESEEQVQNQIRIRKKIFGLADYLLVHNKNSIEDLKKNFQIVDSKIIVHPFPLMNIAKIVQDSEDSKSKIYDFSFIGHLRKNKGIDILLEAWQMMHEKYPNADLLLAGNLPEDSKLNLNSLQENNINLQIKYLTDEEYYYYVKNSKNVVLPYRSGTNSGVVYNLVEMPVNIIYSDLPMFTNNPLLDVRGKFKTNNPTSLFKVMEQFYINKTEFKNPNIDNYKKSFDNSLFEVYSKIINQ